MALPDYISATDKRTAEKLIDAALAKGYLISVCDGVYGEGEWTLKQSKDKDAILNALATTDSDTLRFRNLAGEKLGVMTLIWGNGEDELIADYSVTPEMNTLYDEVNPN